MTSPSAIRCSARRIVVSAALVIAAAAGCAAAGGDAVDNVSGAIVYGPDGRAEYHQLSDPTARDLMARSTVALIHTRWLDRARGRVSATAPTWGDAAGLCAGELFAEQPAVAFCSGLLVDWDLVVTAGHCLRLFALEDFAVVFDYFYAAPGQLAMDAGDGGELLEPVEIVDEMLGHDAEGRLLDYAFVRLGRPASAARRPVPAYRRPPSLDVGTGITTIGAANGLPLKADAGGRVLDPGLLGDYFVASTDTSHGSSGGGAIDARGALVGVLARGGEDLVDTGNGCLAELHADDVDGQEEFTYVHSAVGRLCAADPRASTLCRAECEEPCEALPFDPARFDAAAGGCSITRRAQTSTATLLGLLVIMVLTFLRTRRS